MLANEGLNNSGFEFTVYCFGLWTVFWFGSKMIMWNFSWLKIYWYGINA